MSSKNKIFMLIVWLIVFVLSGVEYILADTVNLTFTSSPAGGGYYTVASTLKDIIEFENDNIKITVVPGDAVVNPVILDAGDAELSISYTLFESLALLGEEPYEKPINKDNLRSIGKLDYGFQLLLVQPGYEASSLDEIIESKMGIRLVIPPRGNTTNFIFRRALEAYGLELEIFRDWGGNVTVTTQHSEGVEIMRDGLADVWAVPALYGSPPIVEIQSTRRPLKFIPYGNRTTEYIEKTLGLDTVTIPAGSFPNQPDDYKALAMYGVLEVRADVPDDIVYQIAKSVYTNKEKLAELVASFKYVYPETSWENLVLPLHPGAEKFFKEMGWMK